MINTKRPTVANFFAQVLRDEINHVQVRNVSHIHFSEKINFVPLIELVFHEWYKLKSHNENYLPEILKDNS